MLQHTAHSQATSSLYPPYNSPTSTARLQCFLWPKASPNRITGLKRGKTYDHCPSCSRVPDSQAPLALEQTVFQSPNLTCCIFCEGVSISLMLQLCSTHSCNDSITGIQATCKTFPAQSHLPQTVNAAAISEINPILRRGKGASGAQYWHSHHLT